MERPYQIEVSLDTLYEVFIKSVNPGISEQGSVSLYIDSGSVDVYGSNDPSSEPSSLLEMTLPLINYNVSGIVSFHTIPNYIAIVQNSGTSTKLVLSGVDIARNLGVIS